jgi:hypothetical protein
VSRDGIAHLSGAIFEVPGVSARADGTFRLRDAHLDLGGTFETAGKLADTTEGLKSAMLKIVSPVWHHNKDKVKTVPFKITGSGAKPNFRLQFHGD